MNKLFGRACIVSGVIVSIFVGIFATMPVYAEVKLPVGRENEWEENNIVFYNPDGNDERTGDCDRDTLPSDGTSRIDFIWNWLRENVSDLATKPEAIAGVLGNAATETGSTFNPFIGTSHFGIFQWGGGRKTAVQDYLKKKGITNFSDGQSEDVIREAITYELEYAITEGQWQSFIDKLNLPTNKVDELGAVGYSELFLVVFEGAINGSEKLTDPNVANSTKYDLWQGVSSRNNHAKDYFKKFKENGLIGDDYNCDEDGGNDPDPNPEVDGYVFPIQSATKSNYLQPKSGVSVLSPLPCTNFANGACHHDYAALDMGIMASQAGLHQYTEAELGYGYSDMYYYSMGAKVIAMTDGTITNYHGYSRAVNGWKDKCASTTFKADDGTVFWIGHTSMNSSIHTGQHFNRGDVLMEIGPPQCAIGTQSHVHIQVGTQSNTNAPTTIYTLMNKLWEALPN